MATLLARSTDAQAQLGRTHIANQVRHQLATIQSRQSEWDGARKPIDALYAKLQWFGAEVSADADLQEVLGKVRYLSGQAQELLRSGTDMEVLTQDELWVRLINQAKTAADTARAAVRAAWRARVLAAGTLPAPEEISNLMMPSPTNQAALRAYREQHERYRALRDRLEPGSESDLYAVDQYARDLQARQQSFALNLPPEVKLFREALPLGAPLPLLTPSVLQWLQEHDDPTRFAVHVKS
ncbi:hypothetical protein WKW80_35430 [Variovorax humicola]|uniref:Uncharacterized protein n=1 Tax=Variovorax humicola TaxID=1769758 RepID=A0ABU8WBB4_9BURK